MTNEFTKAALYGISNLNKKAKEKIGMMKLIELLNEYERNVVMKSYMHPVYYYDEYKNKILNLYIGFNTEYEVKYQWLVSYIVSNSYGFIKWLVENDKIDLGEKLFNLTKNDNRKSIICDLDNNDFSWEDTFLMLLSISDTPIEDLISYLK